MRAARRPDRLDPDTDPDPTGGARVDEPISYAVLRRPLLLLVGVLLVQLGFIASYVGAFHSPEPRDLPVAVVGPDAPQRAEQVDALEGHPLDAEVVADESEAERRLREREVGGVLVIGPDRTDRLLVAGGDGAVQAQAVETVLRQVAEAQRRELEVVDAVPAGENDQRGLSGFYLAIGWVVGGYLAAAVVGIATGPRFRTLRRTAVRLVVMAAYAALSGVGGAVLVGPVLGALEGRTVPLAVFGALLVLAVGLATLALQAWFGIGGVAAAIVLFVVLGNPSAGGAYPTSMLPSVFGRIGPALPPGAGTDGIRGIVYFDGAGVGNDVVVLAAWALAGLALVLAGTWAGRRGDA